MWQFAFQPRVWAVVLLAFALGLGLRRWRQWRARDRAPVARRLGRAVSRRGR